jgi:AcrR family transcriptional regulator
MAIAAADDPQRAALLKAATSLLAEAGPEALTVRRIAARAQCSTMGVYSRFGGKDGIVDALFQEGFDRLGAALDAAPSDLDPADALVEGCRAYRRVALAHPTSYLIMFERAVPDFWPSPTAVEHALAAHGRLVAAMERAVKAGVVAGPAGPAAHALWALCHGLVSLQLHGMSVDVDDDQAFEASVRALVAALRSTAMSSRA